MRKLLQNKWVVSGLATVALGCVAGNFVKFPSRTALTAAAREASPIEAEGTPVSYQVPGVTRFERAVRSWRDLFPVERAAHDPFAWPALAGTSRGTAPQITAAPTNLANLLVPPVFVLQAVSVEADRAFAVINQTVVTEGDQIYGYRVERIIPTQVRLMGALGPLNVTMIQTPPREKVPTAKPPAADLPPASARPVPGGSP